MRNQTIVAGCVFSGLLILLVLGAGCSGAGGSACSALSGSDRDHCYQNIAATTGDLALCDKIEGAGPASKCYAYVAKLNGDIYACQKMDSMPWHRDREAYRWQDCVMYVARSANCPEFCDELLMYQGQATDLNPYTEVSKEKCKASIKCGDSGQPACRTRDGLSLAGTGTPRAYFCNNADGTTSFYPQGRTC